MPEQKEQPVDEKAEEWEEVQFWYGLYSGRCPNCKLFSGQWYLNQPYRFCPFCGEQLKFRRDDNG